MNFRKSLIFFLLKAANNKIPIHLDKISEYSLFSNKEKSDLQMKKLFALLDYSRRYVPYYETLLKKHNVLVDNKVNLKNFKSLPFLTKDILRKNGSALHSTEKRAGRYQNTSGGSTGEPVVFFQDAYYDSWNMANKIYFFHEWFGASIGDLNINIWGSERDVYKNSLSIKEKAINFLYNRSFLNSFELDDQKIYDFIKLINKKKPVFFWAYVESIDYIARFVEKNNVSVYSPDYIITTAGTLYPEIREKIEYVFKCKVYNQYGSREVGFIGIECGCQNGLHVPFWSHYVEIIDGGIYVTLLTNYSMPLIRYQIGDLALPVSSSDACDHLNLEIGDVRGREISHFKSKDGVVHGQYFIHQFYFLDWVEKFQIEQITENEIICRVVLNGEPSKEDMLKIEENISLVMGEFCSVVWNFVDAIPKLPSGKYLYTISNIS